MTPEKQKVAQDIGAELRAKREEGDLTIASIARDLCIRANYLQALEDGHFDLLPGEIYCRGFLSTYASFLELDSTIFLEKLKRANESPSEEANPLGQIKGEAEQDILAKEESEGKKIKKGFRFWKQGEEVTPGAIRTPEDSPENLNLDQGYIPEEGVWEHLRHNILDHMWGGSRISLYVTILIFASIIWVTQGIIADLIVSKKSDERVGQEEVVLVDSEAGGASLEEVGRTSLEEAGRASLEEAGRASLEEAGAGLLPADGVDGKPLEGEGVIPQTGELGKVGEGGEEAGLEGREDVLTPGVGFSDIIIRARQASWVGVMDLAKGGENIVFSKILKAGEVYRVPDGGIFLLKTGNAEGVDVYVGLDRLDINAFSGAVAYLHLHREELLAGSAASSGIEMARGLPEGHLFALE